jgi:hypothetical protein
VAFGISGWIDMVKSPFAPPARGAKPDVIGDDGNSASI